MKCLIPKPFDAGDLARSTLLCDRHMDPTFFFLDTAPLLATPTVQSHSPRLLRCYSEEISCMERSLGCEATFKNIPYRFISRCLEMFHRSCFLLLLLFFLSLSLSSCSQHAPYSSSFMNRDWNFQWIEKNLFYFWLAMYDRTTNLTL